MNWFTDKKAAKLLIGAGFCGIQDRWDLKLEEEGGSVYQTALKHIKRHVSLKILANICVGACAYSALKLDQSSRMSVLAGLADEESGSLA